LLSSIVVFSSVQVPEQRALDRKWLSTVKAVRYAESRLHSSFEAFGLSCVAVLDTSFLEALLPVIAAREFGGDPP
jgi:hypothetical protein